MASASSYVRSRRPGPRARCTSIAHLMICSVTSVGPSTPADWCNPWAAREQLQMSCKSWRVQTGVGISAIGHSGRRCRICRFSEPWRLCSSERSAAPRREIPAGTSPAPPRLRGVFLSVSGAPWRRVLRVSEARQSGRSECSASPRRRFLPVSAAYRAPAGRIRLAQLTITRSWLLRSPAGRCSRIREQSRDTRI